MIEIENTAAEPVTLQGAEPVDRLGEFKVHGVLVAERGADEPLDADSRGFPPLDQRGKELAPIEGYVVPPGGKVQVFIGVEPTRDGANGFRAVRVTYRYEGRLYGFPLELGFIVCSPRERWDDGEHCA